MADTEVKQRQKAGWLKRIIVCCDGTWQDSLGKMGVDPPTNVTRISRILRRTCTDGTPQIISYFPGVGSGNVIDRFAGGVFGTGLDHDIREVYNFICINYVDGDDIILTGFSRGAFTARSVADMIASVGLLTPAGMEHFFAIFQDYEEIRNTRRDIGDYLIPGLPKYGGEKGKDKNRWEDIRLGLYKQGLKRLGYTRDTYKDGVTEIKIKALGVWDTVGSLGIPPAPVIGLNGSADQWRFTNTQISDKVENAFQALGLDEPRYAFRPSLWERINGNKTNLRQVWFPGNHGNVGGGWPDQQIANITLAWMCDQLSTIGVEFNLSRVKTIFTEGLRYSAAHPFPHVPPTKKLLSHSISELWHSKPPTPWATSPIFHLQQSSKEPSHRDAADCDGTDEHPSGTASELQTKFAPRPWALGQTRYPTNAILLLAGTVARRPGRTMRVDGDTNADIDDEPLLQTGERVHSSVRVRLACGGLGTDDTEVWQCVPLLGTSNNEGAERLWRLEKGSGFAAGEGAPSRPKELEHKQYPESNLYPVKEGDSEWRWVFSSRPEGAGNSQMPQLTVLPEEPMVGYWERYLLALTAGESDVWKWAQQNPPLTGSARR